MRGVMAVVARAANDLAAKVRRMPCLSLFPLGFDAGPSVRGTSSKPG